MHSRYIKIETGNLNRYIEVVAEYKLKYPGTVIVVWELKSTLLLDVTKPENRINRRAYEKTASRYDIHPICHYCRMSKLR